MSENYNDLFVRDQLDDDGTIPSPARAYISPDIINYQQVVDPTTEFSQNYNENPGGPIENGQNNYFYIRAKNLGNSRLGGHMKLYWCQQSLLMYPDQWKNNNLTLVNGSSFVELPPVDPGNISVGQQPFVFNPPPIEKGHYCLIGMVISEQHPDEIPDDIRTQAEFIWWVRTHPDICWRNLKIIDDLPNPNYDSVQVLDNISSEDVPITIRVKCTDLPNGTSITIECPLFNPVTEIINENPKSVYASATMPGDFNGFVEVKAKLKEGTTWQGNIQTICYIGVESSRDYGRDLLRFADSWSLHDIGPQECGLTSNGYLVEVGNVNTVFERQSIKKIGRDWSE